MTDNKRTLDVVTTETDFSDWGKSDFRKYLMSDEVTEQEKVIIRKHVADNKVNVKIVYGNVDNGPMTRTQFGKK